ncbi:MAG: aminotransferase class V-fold PLP-dependent enzyme [Pseudomonadota bacterium]
MPLANGRPFLAIPGPSVMPEAVLREMSRPMANIYDGPLVEMTAGLYPDLKRVARTDGRVMIYICNGHGSWEASIVNTLDPGDKILVLDTGRFAIGWGEMAAAHGCEVEYQAAPARRGVDPQMVEDRLRADTAGEIKAVLTTQIDTATGVWNDVAAIRKAIDAAGHPALYMADCMASLGCTPYEMDEWGVDVTLAGSQKGLMTPPGIAFSWVSDKAWEATKRLTRGRAHWAWEDRAEPEFYYQRFHGTAPVQHLYALRVALDMIFAEGLETVWARHASLAAGVRAAVRKWSEGGPLELNVTDPDACAASVTTILTGEVDAAALRAFAEANLGVTLGIGLGMEESAGFRIGHMGHVNAPMVLGALGATELALAHIGAPHATGGVEAAIAAMKAGAA